MRNSSMMERTMGEVGNSKPKKKKFVTLEEPEGLSVMITVF